MRINIDQFALDTQWRGFLWQKKRRHPFLFFKNRIEWYIYPLLRLVPAFPLHIDFEISSLCNLQCPMCYRPHRASVDDGLMDFDIYKKGIDECVRHNLYSIRLSWRGEPMLHPELCKMIAYAKKKGIKEVSFLTNGVAINENMSHDLINSGLDYLSVSIDGINEKYEKIRYPSKFNEMVQKLRTMRHLRDKIGRGYPRIRINSIWSAIKDHKEDYYAIFRPVVDFITTNPDYNHSLRQTEINPNHVCHYLYQRLTIKWNGTVLLCICDKSTEIILGRLGENSLYDIWHGEKLNNFRNMQRLGRIREIAPCAKCQRSITTQIGNQRDVKKKMKHADKNHVYAFRNSKGESDA